MKFKINYNYKNSKDYKEDFYHGNFSVLLAYRFNETKAISIQSFYKFMGVYEI